MSPRTLALCAFLLGSFSSAHAAAADPCAKAAELTSRDQILAAVPADDRAWSDALWRRGLEKTPDGWMQHFQGGTATAGNRAFAAAFEDYCTAKARAASAPKPAPRPAAAAPAAAAEPPARAQAQAAAAKTKDDGLLKKASAFFGSAATAAPAEPAAAPLNCDSLCGTVSSCRDAGMDGGTSSLEFKCRKAAADARAASCSCGN